MMRSPHGSASWGGENTNTTSLTVKSVSADRRCPRVNHDGGVLSDVMGYLICPVCGTDLAIDEGSVRCASNHSFDVARQGYVNLLPGGAKPGTADTAAMVEARAVFLAEGHFASLAELLAQHVASLTGGSGSIVDAGAGTGYYLAAVLGDCQRTIGLALDISKFAARRAARAHPRIAAVVADLWAPLPIRSGTTHIVLNVFAPRQAPEFRRILRPDGALIVVTPTSRHLREVVGPLGLLSVDNAKAQRADAALGERFNLVDRDEHETCLVLSHPTVETLVRMGPSAWHRSPADIRRRLARLPDPVAVTASFTVSTYRPTSGSTDGRGTTR
jgi:23S rRNA (guanine745-N1)-methyltransferase